MSLKERFSDEEIKKMTTLQVNMIHQRKAEPLFKEAIDNEIRKARDK